MVVVIGFAAALFIRLLLIPNPGFEADIAFWKSWGLAVWDFGITRGLPLTNFNYPTPFGYFLALMTGVYRLFADPHDFSQFWLNTNLLFLFISKLPAILADFGIAGIILWIGRHAKKIGFPDLPFSLYALFGMIFLFNPVSIMDSAWWGQVDSLGVFIFLTAVILLLKRKPFWAGLIYMVAMMTKLQNMIYGPLFFLFAWQMTGFTGLVQAAAGALTGFFGLNIEFVLSGRMARVIESLTGNYDYFPWLSLNAFNLWWVTAGARGMQMSDKLLSVGIINAKTVGLYLFSAGYLLSALIMKPFASFGGRKETTVTLIYQFLTALVVANASFFLFQTQSHDRYAFPLIVFLLFWGIFWIRLRLTKSETLQVLTSKPLKIFLWFYGIFSLLYFYNLHTALVFNYPKNGLPLASLFTQPAITIGVSVFFIGLFFWFLFVIRTETSLWSYIMPVALVMLLLGVKNLPLVTGTPVFLTSIAPIQSRQDYGLRQINMPVNASLGFDKWGSLSVQYVFYRHGIGTHANSTQTYDVGKRFRRFSFDYGVDTEAGSKGTVVFEVYGDGKKLFSSGTIGRYELPRHSEVDITGVRMLTLVVTDAGDGITDDHADWLNPLLWSK